MQSGYVRRASLTCRLSGDRLALLSRSLCEGNSPPRPESVLTAESRVRVSSPGARSSIVGVEFENDCGFNASEESEDVIQSEGGGSLG